MLLLNATPQPLRDLSDVPVVGTEAMRALDRATSRDFEQPGAVLMERAASAAAALAMQRFIGQGDRVAILVGPGNNGGDGSAMARLLHHQGIPVTICLAAEEEALRGDAASNLRAARAAGVPVSTHDKADAALDDATLWVDALLGIGLRDPLRGAPLALLKSAAARRQPGHRVLAIDLPSGLHDETGVVFDPVLRADATVTFGALKRAFFTAQGVERCGEIYFSDIGIPHQLSAAHTDTALFGSAAATRLWRPRGDADHKTRSGSVLVVAGAGNTPGAGVLSACAAARSGAGLTTLIGGDAALNATVARNPSIMVRSFVSTELAELAPRFDAIALGPGLGVENARVALQALDNAQPSGTRKPPLVLDADALSALAAGAARPEGFPLILTPHPGELARLLKTSITTVLEDLFAAAQRCARRFDATVIAKGAGTCVTDGTQTRWIYGAAPVLGSGGSGDVLTGITTAFAARYSPVDAAALGAWMHVRTARQLEQELGVEGNTAELLLERIPAQLRDYPW